MAISSRLTLVLLLTGLATPMNASDGNHLKREIHIPSNGGGFDYVTYAAGKLYIGHRPEGLQVVNLNGDTKVGNVDKTATSNGATVAPELDLGFSENGNGTITVFKLSDLSVVEQIKVGAELDSTRYDPATKRLAVFGLPGKDKTSSKVAIFQMPNRKLIGEIDAPSAKLENSIADGTGGVFVNAQDMNSVLHIDMAKMVITKTFPVPCNQPTGLDYDKDGKRLFIGCRGAFTEPMFVVANPETGEIVFKAPTSPGNDGVAYDSIRKRVYLTDGIGAHLVVFEQMSLNTYTLNEVVGTRPMAKTIAIDPVSGDVFSIAAESVFDASKKNLALIAPFYPNQFTKDTFEVLVYGR
jgi:DNA-binding beta-propeller fold protein YncE